MARYLVEAYQPRQRADDLRAASARAHAVARELSALGTPVRYVRCILVPEDEICFHVFEAPSAAAVAEANERAALAGERIVEAVFGDPTDDVRRSRTPTERGES
jgi:hypothetical protein